jgi:hypothetical protein
MDETDQIAVIENDNLADQIGSKGPKNVLIIKLDRGVLRPTYECMNACRLKKKERNVLDKLNG